MTIMRFVKKAVKAILPHGAVVLYKRRLDLISKVSVSGRKNSLDNNKIALMVPFRNVKYAELVESAIKRAGYEVVSSPSDAKYIWLHWYENGIESYSDFLGKLSTIKTWKDQGRKIILHIHNKKPHESPVPNISHALMTSLADCADHISIMSTETKKVLKDTWYYGDDFSRVSTVPHPNYIGAYGSKLKLPASLKNDTFKILFFGLVRPYKGIEYLIEATDGMDDVEISIFGKPKDDEYVAKIMALCADRKNIKFRLEHILDEDIPQIFAGHHVLALPYSAESSLNSGAAILALSYARTIIGTNNGTLKELGNNGLYFGYDYKNEQDHVKQLRKTILSVQDKYRGNYNAIVEVGERAFELVQKDNGIEAVSRSIDEMVKRIV
jgi:beta-1,4-mannosyltransferase